MIRILLVDDEPIIRKGIRVSIDWEALGMEIVGEAGNGADALRLAASLKPNIVMTDIRMPSMDGLTLADQLRQQLPDTKIVIVSGYEDFAYARKAISVGVNDYLLKPVGAENLIEVLAGLKETILQAEASKSSRQSQEHVWNENYPTIKSSFINKLLKGGYASDVAILAKADSLRVNLTGPDYAIAAIAIDDFGPMTDRMPESGRQLLKYAIMNISEEIILSKTAGVVVYGEQDQLIALISADELTGEFMESLAQEIQVAIRQYIKLSVSIGLGGIRDNLLELAASYAEALDALRTNKDDLAPSFRMMVASSIQYIEQHYAEDFSLADIAGTVYVTPNYLSRVFKEETGMNFVHWLNRYRVEKAKLFLCEPGAKTYEVAARVGYGDYKYFSTMFKKHAGCTPKEFKDQRRI
ncbi:response regulator [Cohnella yongneupensis]|uniref:Response regulator n=1 Tax=Cohnella yongneupensis TaxID=425006 RepID=A0ABW0QWG0_9BACL